MEAAVLVEKRMNIGWLTMNRPDALNALSLTMRDEIRQALEELGADQDIRVVVITGAGRAFCAGGDVKEQNKGYDASSGRQRIRNLDRLLLTMVNLDKPIICAVNGTAVGAGCNLALAGDIIIAAEEAKFSEIFVNIGLIPDFGGMYFLPRLAGLPKAKEIVFTGRMVGAAEALEIGLINRVVPRTELETAVMKLAQEIAGKSPTAISLAKSVLNRSFDCDLPALLELEAFAQGVCFQSEEHRRLLREFLAQRSGK